MPYSVFFNEGVAVHGTSDLRNLGRPASHGCVRSHPKNAKIFYNLVHKHGMQMTRVTVRGKPPYSPVVAEGAPPPLRAGGVPAMGRLLRLQPAGLSAEGEEGEEEAVRRRLQYLVARLRHDTW